MDLLYIVYNIYMELMGNRGGSRINIYGEGAVQHISPKCPR